jgi:23S rRNA (adenine2503-C2)-methyltransferase
LAPGAVEPVSRVAPALVLRYPFVSMSSPPPELEGTSRSALTELLQGSGRAASVWRLLRDGIDPFVAADGALSSGLLRRLEERTRAATLGVESVDVAECGTRKLRYRLSDDKKIETVLIPGSERTTVCISSQVGCARGCIFCVTATMGLARGLTVGEITGQVVRAVGEARRASLPPVKNVVFMGMGEPLDNFEAVKSAIGILCDPRALAFAPRHVTLSTVGPTPEAILRILELAAPVKIAWSVHAVDEELRRRLVPTMRHSMKALREAFLEITQGGRTLFLEVALMHGVNDGLEHAEALASFFAAFSAGVRVNLLPMNRGRDGLAPSSLERSLAYRQCLREKGYFCAIRRPRGAGSSAACGQLAVPAVDATVTARDKDAAFMSRPPAGRAARR